MTILVTLGRALIVHVICDVRGKKLCLQLIQRDVNQR